ncbi:hypothetical protein V6N13_121130 [Hibiscus sabdariffa]
MSLSLSFTNPILSRHVYSAVCPPPPPRFLFLSPRTTTTSRFHILYRAPQRAAALSATAATASIIRDTAASAAVFAGAYALVFTFDILTEKELIQQSLSRKLVHIFSGLLFAISWPIFRLVTQGLSSANDQSLIKSVTREGDPKELLRGPLYYVVTLMLCTLLFWRESPVGLISLGMMCGGDGVADIMGRKFGSAKIPYNQGKSWVGSISMFVFGFFISIGMVCYYSALGYFQLDWGDTVQRVALVSLVATVVESLPISNLLDDNISVPLASMLAAYFFFTH